jgi:phosphonopyruvate decarboxylase
MLDPQKVYEYFNSCGIDFYAGVPDSLLKEFCSVITDKVSKDFHTITANEGNAIALAAGYYAGSGKPALVYMQNSGLGNAINPLISLADKEVFGIPMLVMIGWRGQPGVKDEVQHLKQGLVTIPILETLGLPYFELNALSDFENIISKAMIEMKKSKNPVAILVSKDTFKNYTGSLLNENSSPSLTREKAINVIIDNLGKDFVCVSTTGMTSRELYERREKLNESHKNDLYIVGSMGHASSIAMGLAIGSNKTKVVCLDGDGSMLMHMGCLPIIGQSNLKNLLHIVINNGAHDSVGGQPTVGMKIDLKQIAIASGYQKTETVDDENSLKSKINDLKKESGPIFLEVKVKIGARSDLGRPNLKPSDNIINLIKSLN